MRLASPAHWMPKISAHRRCSSGPSLGTNGVPGTSRFRPSIVSESENAIRRNGFRAAETVQARHDSPIGLELGDIDVLGDRIRVAANGLAVADTGRFSQQAAVLGDQAVAAEDDIGGRFRRAGPGHGVGCDGAAGLTHDEIGTIAALADGLVAGRDVER